MKFTAAAVLAAATGAFATGHGNVTVVTEVVESYVTFCPGPTTISHGSQTYTVTEPTTLTITDCPCTITRPVTTTTSTVCHTCPGNQPGYTNSTAPGLPPTAPGVPPPTGGVPSATEPAPTSVPTAAAFKAGLSGVAGAVGLAAFFL